MHELTVPVGMILRCVCRAVVLDCTDAPYNNAITAPPTDTQTAIGGVAGFPRPHHCSQDLNLFTLLAILVI
jgi:hypothetical protein